MGTKLINTAFLVNLDLNLNIIKVKLKMVSITYFKVQYVLVIIHMLDGTIYNYITDKYRKN